jgi:5-methylcytosine-specific restriction endonuclease McrA
MSPKNMKWRDTSKHWSKTGKREEVLGKITKYLKPGYKGPKKTSEDIRKLNEGKDRWVKNNPNQHKAKYEKMRRTYKADGNPHWKGGSKSWCHKQALIRDDYTCQVCGLRDMEIMEADHVMPKSKYPKLAYEMDNIVTLCPNCHRRKTVRENKEKAYR